MQNHNEFSISVPYKAHIQELLCVYSALLKKGWGHNVNIKSHMEKEV